MSASVTWSRETPPTSPLTAAITGLCTCMRRGVGGDANGLLHAQLAPAIGLDEAALVEGLDVGAGRERVAGAGDDRHPDVGVLLDARPALAQLILHLLVHGVHPLRPVQRQSGDAIAYVEGDRFQGHGVSSSQFPVKATSPGDPPPLWLRR